MTLPEFLALMERVAPLRLAAEWDNVGLLLAPRAQRPVERVLLTIDLTDDVLSEAEREHCDAVIAYHPPIFAGLKRLLPDDPSDQVILRLIESRLVVYSPHTALDAVEGGVNDWLASFFSTSTRRAIEPYDAASNAVVGQGRLLQLAQPLTLSAAVALVKEHVGASVLRVADATDTSRCIRSVALCAGAGGSVVTKVAADLYLSGEMRHHDVLRAVATGTSVVLTEHSNSERGYLPHLAQRLRQAGLHAIVAATDSDPLRCV